MKKYTVEKNKRYASTKHQVWRLAVCGVITLGSLFGQLPSVKAASQQYAFEDIHTSYAKDAIAYLVQKGIAQGTTANTFEPKKAVTRAEFATFAVGVLGLKPVENQLNPYSDMNRAAWYYGNIAAMTNLSILEGKGQNTFQPNASITREEAAAILVRMLKQTSKATERLSSLYEDTDDISGWARPYVQTVYQLGLMQGSEGRFRPYDQVTREEAAVMLNGILQKSIWAAQLQRKVDTGVQLGWQYNSSTAAFKQQVQRSLINTVVPRWFFLGGDMKVSNHADPELISWAKSTGRQIWPLFGNRFDAAATHQMLSSSTNRAAVISQVTSFVKTYKLNGINVDFENVNPEDRDQFTAFITELASSLHALHAVVSVDVSPDFGTDWTAAYDYAKLGAVSDYIVLMGYEEHWNGDPKAGSVASLPWLDRSLKTMLSKVPPAKSILALPLYTRDWLAVNPATSSWDITLSEQGVRATTPGAVRHWDNSLKQYVIRYNSGGMQRWIWAEESRSLSAKVLMGGERNIAGLAYWYMGGETTDNWNAVNNALRFTSYKF